jgi:GcrA cell cycle regulator
MWTDTQVEQLRALCGPDAAEALSAAQIAARIGQGRSSVLGKVLRLGLSLPNSRNASPPRAYSQIPAKAREAAFERPETARVVRPSAHPHAPSMAIAVCDKPASKEIVETEIAIPLRVSLVDLADNGCRWPLGDPASAAFRYCGLPASSGPYCRQHSKLAYQPRGAQRPAVRS